MSNCTTQLGSCSSLEGVKRLFALCGTLFFNGNKMQSRLALCFWRWQTYSRDHLYSYHNQECRSFAVSWRKRPSSKKVNKLKQMCNLSFCITLTHIIEHFKVCKIKEETKSWDGWTDAQHNRSLGFFIIFTSCVNFVWAHKLWKGKKCQRTQMSGIQSLSGSDNFLLA